MDSLTSYRRLFLRSLAATAFGALLVAVCYFYVDRPVAFFVHDHQFARHEWLLELTKPEPIVQLWRPHLWSLWRPGTPFAPRGPGVEH